MRPVMVVMTLAAAALPGGCKSAPGGPAGNGSSRPAVAGSAAERVGDATLPAPVPELAGLQFLAGRWAMTMPGGSINREHWMTPAGRSMTAVFEQTKPDGLPGFYEISSIVVEPDGSVLLYHRQLAQRLTVDPKRLDVDLFRLKSLDAGAHIAVFEPASPSAAGAGGILTMTYRSDGPDRLVQEVAFKPGSKEKDFSTTYQRE